ncbi:leucine carboxyl methyltransferase 1 homolog isoform X6 [Magnolia sinica]|uniref:leucine carboxyl methyltransferase 1 homolog isoform X6 n=1 Tax=Magnolia sinica TaxID=86752 RepID=UPI00265901A1|nr:leucine carboxyl methyltransferase 1 homolog isoform X6 [Magnolia sinica]
MSKLASDSHSSTAAVQATNDDASASKLSCVNKGYMKDSYIHFFVRRPVKRSPIINRGYYARWAALRKLLLQFLKSERHGEDRNIKKQILSLGAGFDTTYFQLQEEGIAPHLYVELDFKEVTSKKAALIDSSQLKDKVGQAASISRERGEVLSDHYKLLPVDLREIQKLDNVIALAELDPCLPTFIIAECVLIYLDPDSSRAIIHPDDAFGEQMIRNLEKAVAWDMLQIYNNSIDTREKRRVERLELFDEFEEWHMMQEHYCVAYAINDAMGLFQYIGFSNDQHVLVPSPQLPQESEAC